MASIQKDNYLLLTRMAEIMQTKGTIDNYNDYQVKRYSIYYSLAADYDGCRN